MKEIVLKRVAEAKLVDLQCRIGVVLRQMPKHCAACDGRGVIIVARGAWKQKPTLQRCFVCPGAA